MPENKVKIMFIAFGAANYFTSQSIMIKSRVGSPVSQFRKQYMYV